LSHAEVADAGVVGLPDAQSGELPVALVVLRNTSSASEKDLLGYVAGALFSLAIRFDNCKQAISLFC
jgi:acyl-coenzyme A synthetase/AMP-(fatty) acid ligase